MSLLLAHLTGNRKRFDDVPSRSCAIIVSGATQKTCAKRLRDLTAVFTLLHLIATKYFYLVFYYSLNNAWFNNGKKVDLNRRPCKTYVLAAKEEECKGQQTDKYGTYKPFMWEVCGCYANMSLFYCQGSRQSQTIRIKIHEYCAVFTAIQTRAHESCLSRGNSREDSERKLRVWNVKLSKNVPDTSSVSKHGLANKNPKTHWRS